MDDNIQSTIIVARLNGKKTTVKGKEYWEISDTARNKYRLYSEGLYNRFKVKQEYDVEFSEFSGSFTNEKGIEVDYTIKTIQNILSVPLDEQEPLDKVFIDEKVTNLGSAKQDSPDWDAIARGKVRTQMAKALIINQGLVALTDEMKEILEQYVDYSMGEE